MRIAVLVVSCGLLLGASGAAEAGWFGSKQPKPISVLNISPPWNANHAGSHVRQHRYNKPGWGAQWKQFFRMGPYRAQPYVRGY